ncbi:MAG: ATP-binding cassette domain-containing protein [Acidimicrobiaceae bacterium]|nr:ATP-binding cassette domain-containing protein [Acidimicrobiaceae bacterium]
MAKLCAVVVLVLSPGFGIPSWNLNTAVLAGILGLAALGVNVLIRFGRMVNLGGASFLGLAAYGAVLATTRFGIPYVPAAFASLVIAAVVAWISGGIFARLPNFYFAVAMLGTSAAIDGVLAAFPGVTQGDSGLTTTRTLPLGLFTVNSGLGWYVTIVVITVAVIPLTYRLVHGWRGRLFSLLREDPLAASVHGVEVTRARRVLFTASAILAALSGVLLARWQGVIVPQDAGLTESVQLLGFAIVGGSGSPVGPVIGASLLTWLSAATSGLGDIELFVYGLIFFLVVAYFQGGVVGAVDVMTSKVRRRYRSVDNQEPVELKTDHGSDVTANSAVSVSASRLREDPGNIEPPGSAGRLEVMNVSKIFGGIQALDCVSIEARPAVVTAIVGANGAGKSTLLNIITGVETPTGGEVHFEGRCLTPGEPVERARVGIARTFQTARVALDLTVEENVWVGAEAVYNLALFGGRNRRPDIGLTERCREALAEAGLGHIAQRKTSEIGGGRRKIIEVARAIALEPRLLIMDEPGAGLTLEELSRLERIIDSLRSKGTSVVIVDHNLDFVANIADCGYVLELGRVAYTGEVNGLREYMDHTGQVMGSPLETGRHLGG